MITLPTRVPAWVYGAVLLIVLAGAGILHQRAAGDAQGRAAVQKLWDADKAALVAAESKAVAQRVADNAVLAAQQVATSAAITKAYDEEISTVRARLVAAERMRRPAFCASAGPAAPTGAGGAENGLAADPAGGLLPDAVERDIQALILETEQVATTGRACQAFVRGNGMAP